MKIKDMMWVFILVVISLFVFLPMTNSIFVNLTTSYPYFMGFLKTMILASMGEILVKRIRTGYYFKDPGVYLKALVWGFLGMAFAFVFPLFDGGIKAVFNEQVIFENVFLNNLIYAFMISFSMNVIFAPTFMMFHRFSDTYIDLAEGSMKKLAHIEFHGVVKKIDYQFFFSFVIIKTIPFFWIPAHTITFMLPSQYRVLMASYLSIILGILLSIKNKEK
ncbi:hypothetical protein BK010_09725 [Tenericutes bacterium MO-XQ]|nr:hypothetical protein BK010_09725 [Tenericutes bacterium MO-XQ]